MRRRDGTQNEWRRETGVCGASYGVLIDDPKVAETVPNEVAWNLFKKL